MSFVAFILALLLGLSLLSGAVVVSLGTLMHSWVAAFAVVGIVYLAVACAIYIFGVRRTMLRWQHRMGIIYEVSATVDHIYREVRVFLRKIVGGL